MLVSTLQPPFADSKLRILIPSISDGSDARNDRGAPDVIPEAAPEKRAPDPLRVVQQFVNSVDLERGEDDLDTPTALRDWMAARDLIPPGARVTQADLRRAVDVREGLRAVLLAHNGGTADPEAVERLERAAGTAALRTRFPGGAPDLAPAVEGADAGLARLLATVALSATEGSWQRLKACADDECRWAFYDHSKNRSGRWCSMADCGNQHKARAFRERRRSRSAAAD